jgi:exodeoxyribonuclease VII large subunit
MEFLQNQPEYSVSEIAGHVKRMVEETFGFVRVRGEISRPNINAASGHCYLTLKDDKAVLDAVCWKGTMSKLTHKPQAGMEVIATGKLTTYPGASKYQLIIESLEPAGIGALMAMLEERKKMLQAEGLFDAARKKPLPFLPEVIGIVTSPTGAVIRDILHRLADRFPRHVLLWPVPVQGAAAAEKIAAAIDGFNKMPHPPDLLIVARGGGSIEDLWAFNEEVVVRAAAASRIPLISAVGHETDTTLIDFAADKRAPTPTAAAELAVPVRSELLSRLEQLHANQNTAMRKFLAFHAERIAGLARGLPRPQQLVAGMAQALDMLSERLLLALPRSLALREEKLQRIAASLSPRYLRQMLQQQEQRVTHLAAMLESLNVLGVLKRGFALVKNANGHVIASAAQMPASATLSLQFHDGERRITTGGTAPRPRKKAAPQPGLFDE